MVHQACAHDHMMLRQIWGCAVCEALLKHLLDGNKPSAAVFGWMISKLCLQISNLFYNTFMCFALGDLPDVIFDQDNICDCCEMTVFARSEMITISHATWLV